MKMIKFCPLTGFPSAQTFCLLTSTKPTLRECCRDIEEQFGGKINISNKNSLVLIHRAEQFTLYTKAVQQQLLCLEMLLPILPPPVHGAGDDNI